MRARNEPTLAEFGDAEFERMRAEALEVLDTDARIPYVRRRGEYLYNFWRDAANPRGLWRRTTLDSYRTDSPEWDVLIDVDELGRADDEKWVWAGAGVIEPELHARADQPVPRRLGRVHRARIRHADTRIRRRRVRAAGGQVADRLGGRRIPCWWAPTSAPTRSPNPATRGSIKRWRRGTPLADAETVFEGTRTDVRVVRVGGSDTRLRAHPAAGGPSTSGTTRSTNCAGSELIRIDAPTDASMSIHREWLLIELRTDWYCRRATTYRAGSLLAADYDEFLGGHSGIARGLRARRAHRLHHYAWTRDRLLMVTLADVASRVEIVTPGTLAARAGRRASRPRPTPSIVAADDTGDEFFLDSSGFDTPSRLMRGTGTGQLDQIKSAPAFFDAENIDRETAFRGIEGRHGDPVLRRAAQRSRDGPGPTLLGGYGGFESANTPGYSGVLGRLWLARGGTYVLANIRGGGEYGPSWHTQAMREGRHKVAEDFAAVATDLVNRGITTVEQLGAQGGSNGGLLMGIMLTQYPEKFGALVCGVPLLDMKRYHLLLAGASWVAEYGDPDNPDDWEFISEYSPYQNISATRHYPPVLITTSTRDDRVHPGHARKMTAALEAAGHRVWYYENIEGGHAGAADNEQIAFKSALSYSFLWRMLTPTPRG